MAYGQHAFEVDDQGEPNDLVEELRQHATENPVLADLRKERTAWAIEQIRRLGPEADWDTLRSVTTSKLAQDVRIANVGIKDGGKLPVPSRLPYQTAAEMLLALDPIHRIGAPQIEDGDEPLGWYVEDGPDAGTYTTNEKVFTRKILALEDSLSSSERYETLHLLHAKASTVQVVQDPELIPVKNGIIHYTKGEFFPHDPDYVFMSKIATDLSANPKHPDLRLSDGRFFHIDDMMFDLADGDEELVELLWQIIGAVLRPNMAWGKVGFLLGEGKNGKSTFIELLRNVVGPSVVANLRLHQLGHEFLVGAELPGKTAVIADENPPNTYLDDSSNLKQLVMGEPLLLNRKHREPINYQFKGMVIQSFNDMPRTKDKSTGMYRRIIAVPFNHSFKGQKDFPEIKKEFMLNKQLHEYVLHQALIERPKFYKIHVPPAAQRHLETFKLSNDPVRAFWNKFRERFAWGLLMWDFIYDLYKQWMKFENPEGKMLSLDKVRESLEKILEDDNEWEILKKQIRVGVRMDGYESLIEEYKLPPFWANKNSGTDHGWTGKKYYLKGRDRIYGGIIRRKSVK